MSVRPTISIYFDGHIVDIGYYRNWSNRGLLLESCRLAKRLDGSESYEEVRERLDAYTLECDGPACPELDPAFDAPERDRKLTQMLAPLYRKGGHHPEEELMLEMESYSESPWHIDVSRRVIHPGDASAITVAFDDVDGILEILEG